MNFEEHAAKPLLHRAGIPTPKGGLAHSASDAREIADGLGKVVVKAQVPTGKRGKAGGIRSADTPSEAFDAAQAIIEMEIAGYEVTSVWVEERLASTAEFYAAVLNDAPSRSPMVIFSFEGGMDIEEVAASMPDRLRRVVVDIRHGFGQQEALALLDGLPGAHREKEGSPGIDKEALADILARLYRAFRDNDAELLEINPLAQLADASFAALDCKFVLDDSAIVRRRDLAEHGRSEQLTGLEARAREAGLRYIELSGDIGVIANGAGLTMTTMDVIARHGGEPANFLEIGGDSYIHARPALELLLDNPRVRSLVVNFCGAFARTDVMTQGIVEAWKALGPSLPIFFCVHGTGSKEARAMLREDLGIEPFETMDEAIIAAIAGAKS
ncbi:succinate--CoA ligase subunit beta [Thioalkalivibrio sp. HK1]|uniref:succinate--CoA ligase subunit beta n=1 Tax=Thioalkalivibrio sp. HK1 TaxID=1469245 RepID=UPI00047035D2|nr:ATP-grasp domain-containing protein [Thioalkalivibrio sp. HK1]